MGVHQSPWMSRTTVLASTMSLLNRLSAAVSKLSPPCGQIRRRAEAAGICPVQVQAAFVCRGKEPLVPHCRQRLLEQLDALAATPNVLPRAKADRQIEFRQPLGGLIDTAT